MKNNIGKRLLSLLLCLVLVVSYLPSGALQVFAVGTDVMLGTTRVTDPSTIDQWKKYFGAGVAPGVEISTEFAGGVWTDKSVFTPDSVPAALLDASYGTHKFTLNDKGDNFLVALSALASNKQIKGYSTIPTDTVLILDLSSSMRYTGENNSSAVDELVTATNTAIAELQSLNVNNRVSVVVYAGTDNNSWSSRNGKTRVILPLDSYTTTTPGKYLQSTTNSGGTANYALQVLNGVKNSAGQAVHQNTKFEVSTGTFMQDGIYMGMQQLLNADPVVESGFQAGTNRIPIMVLMTDGEPTLGHNNYYGSYTTEAGEKTFTDLGNSNMYHYDGSTGGTNSRSHRDTIAFMTSLTAAFAKKQITSHYAKQGLMYTLAYGTTVTTRSEAMSVLNPKNSSQIQENLWNAFLNDEEVRVYRHTSGNGWNQQTSYLTAKNHASDPDLRLNAQDRYYVDGYYAAADDASMSTAFDAIVDEIELQSRYYPTYVESDHNHDGYLTFVDKIGSYMEVSSIKGIEIGSRLFSGEALASQLTTDGSGNVTMSGDQANRFLQSVCDRLGVDTIAQAQTLVNNAAKYGQLSYNAGTGAFEHYIGWFSDSSGDFLDFWYEGLAEEDYPSDATHIMRSYGFLGDTAVIPGVPTTDMMFMTVRVATEITTGESILTWKIPASLVPTVTYDVEVELDSNGNLTALQSLQMADGSATAPIRLLYEVELRRDINEWNLLEKTGGTTTFYSNKFELDPSATSLNTYSHFEPSEANERYYYTADALIYADNSGTVYQGAKPVSGTYYHRYTVYEKLEGGQLRIHYHYDPITQQSLAQAEPADEANQWQIPKGTVMRYQDNVTTAKESNPTGTMAYSDHPEIVGTGGHYYTYSTQGNNGKLTVTPVTGIKLTKTLTEQVPGAENSFTFNVSGDIANAQVIRLDSNGNETYREALSGGQVTLKAGETVYIIGLTDSSYTVTENAHDAYTVAAVEVDGVTQSGKHAVLELTAQTIHSVEFTNMPKGYGRLFVSKDVVYPEGLAPTQYHNDKEFQIEVAFTGDTTGMVVPAGATLKAGTEQTYTVNLKDGQSVTFSNIAEGVTYAVSELAQPAGYSWSETRYTDDEKTIHTDDADQAHVINTYAPQPANANLKVRGSKAVTGGWPTGASFTVRLWQVYDLGSGDVIETIRTATVTEANSDYTIDISDVDFEKAGTYYIRVAEDIPADADRIPDMAYDRTLGLFSVTVTDEDADGKLEIKDGAVVGYQGTPVTGDASTGWIVTKDFTNVVTKDLVYLDIEKSLDGYTGANPPLADITFGLFTDMSAENPAFNGVTDASGQVTLMVPVTKASIGSGLTYYLREIAPAIPGRVVGMRYDESWIYAIHITWDDVNHEAVVEYAPIENDVVGTFAPYDRSSVTFTHTNPYTSGVESTPAIRLSGTKTMSGDTTSVGNRVFRFSIFEADATFTPNGNAMQTVSNVDDAITFQPITFDSAGMKYLVIRENATSLGGVQIDNSEYHVTVLVEKYSDGGVTKLRVADGYPTIVKYGATDPVAKDAIDFNNTYTLSGSVDATVTGTKTLTGRPLLLGGFEFRLSEAENADGDLKAGGLVLTAHNGAADGNTAPFHFPAITYTSVGTHYYVVQEVPFTPAQGITFSKARYVVRITISDNGDGTLKASQQIVSGGSKIAFTNTYKPQPVSTTLRSVKELNGKVLTSGQFSFRIQQTDSTFENAKSGGLVSTVTNDVNGLIEFPKITFEGEDTRYYVIEEVNGGQTIDGITYDDAKYRVIVKATDNLLGELVLVTDIQKVDIEDDNGTPVTVISPSSSIIFTNEYAVKGDATLILSGEKTFTGGTLSDGKFTFQLMDAESNVVASGVNNANAYSIRLDYTADADLGKTYQYVLKELYAGQTINGVTYASNTYQITVKVEDDGTGGIELIVTTDGQQSTVSKVTTVTGLNFTNTYAAEPTSVVIQGKKTLDGEKTLSANLFSFQLFPADSEFNVTGAALDTAKNGADGNAADTFSFQSQALNGKDTYYFVVREDSSNPISGVRYDESEFRVTVVVDDEGLGQLKVKEITYQKADTTGVAPAAGIRFTNSYDADDASVIIRGVKNLDGKTLTADAFTFRLYKTDSSFATDGLTPVEKKNSLSGAFAFTDLSFDTVGTHYYVVEEAGGGQTIDGITYDSTVYRITVQVWDNGGKLIPAVTVDKAGATVTLNGTQATVSGINFTNTYTAQSAQFKPEAIKQYERPDGEAMLAFTFTLTGEGENQVKQNSLTDGKVSFDTLTFTKAKTYTYTISETPTAGMDYIKWDTNVYTLKVEVTDNGKGKLEIASITTTSVKGADDLKFLNAHEDLILKKDAALPAAPTLTIDRKAVEVGDELTYTISYTNYNNQVADVTITDTIAQYTAFVSATNGGTYDNGKVTWQLKDVPAGETVTVTLRVKVIGGVGQQITNQASVLDAGNTYTSNEVVNPVKEDRVAKDVFEPGKETVSIDGKAVEKGDILLYKITYINTDDFPAEVTITDTIPAYTSYVDGSASAGGSLAGNKLTWNLQLSAGATETVTFRVKVTGSSGQVVENQAVAQEGSNILKTEVVRNPITEDEFRKEVLRPGQESVSIDGKTVEKGDILLYKITYTNTDSFPADVTITDTIPAYTSYVDGSASAGGIFAAGKLTWSFRLEAGQTETVTFRVKVIGGGQAVQNQAIALEGENILKTETVANPIGEDQVSKDVFEPGKETVSIDGKTVEKGDILLYKITYTNSDNFPAEVTITDMIPAHTAYVANSADKGGVFESGKLTWNLQLSAGATETVTFRVEVTGSGAQVVENQAVAQEGDNLLTTEKVRNPIGEDKISKDVFEPGKETVSIDGKTVEKGDTLLYKITYTNTDSFPAEVTVTDTIPAHTAYVDGSASDGGVFESGKLTWNFQLAAGASKTVTFRVKVADTKVTVENTATGKEGNNEISTNATRNPVEEDLLVKDVFSVTEPTVSIDGKAVEKGDILVYQVTYQNLDGFAADVTVTDTIPAYTAYVDGSASDGAFFDGSKLTWNFRLEAGASKTVTFRVKVTGTNVTVANQASALEGGNTVQSNQVTNPVKEDTLTKDVFLAEIPNVSIDGKTVNPGQILQYAITYTNTDDLPGEVTVTDKIPAHTTYIAGSASNGGVYTSGELIWVFTLEAGASKTVTFQVKVDGADVTVTNRATGLEGENTVQSNQVEIPVKDDLLVKDVARAVAPNVSIDGQQVKMGTVLQYAITYTNTDDAKAEVTITDTIPAHTTYVAGSATEGGVFENGSISWTMTLEPGASKTVTFQVKTNTYNTSVVNKATAYDGTNLVESNQVTTEVPPAPVTPETGDEFQIGLFIGLMATSAIGLAVLLLAKKKEMILG